MTASALMRSETTQETPRPSSVVVAGLALLMLAWILLIPPFGGSDEFDHAYRAAATAQGQWVPTPSDATRGTGAWVQVPRDIVTAARPQCQARVYTTAADCVGTVHGDMVRIASGAGRYHPLFYAVVGTAALPFHGTAALYVMRLATAAFALALVALALMATGRWARTWVGRVGVVVAATPVLVYSCSIVAPNGVEMAAALAFWAAGTGLLVARPEDLGRLSSLAAVSGVLLCTLRPLGPLWCLLSVAALVVGVRAPHGRVRDLLARRDVRISAGLVCLSALQSAVWTLSMGALRVGQVAQVVHTTVAHRVGEVLALLPVWVLQNVAAFPQREDATNPSVYVCYLIVFGVIVVGGSRVADRRLRQALWGIAVLSLALPFVTTVSSYDTQGAAWQGRYGLPFTLGMVVLAALALDRAGATGPGGRWLLLAVLYVAAQVVSVVSTLHVELASSPSSTVGWVTPPYWLVAVLAGLGSCAMWWGALPRAARRRQAEHAEADDDD